MRKFRCRSDAAEFAIEAVRDLQARGRNRVVAECLCRRRRFQLREDVRQLSSLGPYVFALFAVERGRPDEEVPERR